VVHVVAGACGVSAIVLASADLFSVLKWIGAGYLVYLGIRALWAARRETTEDFAFGARELSNGPAKAFREGILVEALNPKTAAFFLAFIPQFVDPAAGPIALQFLALGFVAVLLNTAVDITVAIAAGRLSDGAMARPGLIRRLRQASGGAMIALGLGLAFARRPAV
jgi:threonine/homoserine/homoserine lactone efflux protein